MAPHAVHKDETYDDDDDLNSLHVIGCGGKDQCTHNLITG
jgi:hypothetical protein